MAAVGGEILKDAEKRNILVSVIAFMYTTLLLVLPKFVITNVQKLC